VPRSDRISRAIAVLGSGGTPQDILCVETGAGRLELDSQIVFEAVVPGLIARWWSRRQTRSRSSFARPLARFHDYGLFGEDLREVAANQVFVAALS
jgi:hypothetical protein